MRAFGYIATYIATVLANIYAAHEWCDPGTEKVVFLVLSCIFAFCALGFLIDTDNPFIFIVKAAIAVVAVPFFTVMVMIPFELLFGLIETFGVEGTLGIGIIIAIIILILSSCTFIFFF